MERTVRNFKLVEQIGTGGMGVIYRAIQTTLDRPVAFKELHPHLARDADFLKRFEREAKTAATLQHENIVGVIDFGQDGESYFIAMEYVDGADLKGLMSKEPKVVLPVAVSAILDVLRGLEHAHSRGIVHRDIKPANVMVTKDGVVKIADFSIAQAATMPSMTVTGAMMGTPAYMSPEQAGGGKQLDARTDLFSTGVILWEMLAGRRPFDGDTYAVVISRLLTVTPPDLSEIDRTVPVSIAKVAKKALAKDPDRRYANAAAFRQDLEQAALEEKIPFGRQLIVDWVKAPKEFQTSLRRRQARDAYQRGVYLMGQGLARIDDAIASLEAAVILDPDHDEAKKQLEELKGKRSAFPRGLPIGLGAGIGAAVLLALFAWHPWARGPVATPTPIAVVTTAPPATTIADTATPAGTIATATPTAVAAGTRHVSKATPTPPLATPVVVATTSAPVSTPTAAPTHTELALVDPERKDEGFLKIVTHPWAKVYVDGRYVADTPIAKPITLPIGSHELKLTNDAYAPYVETIEIPPGTLVSRNVTLKKNGEP
jgi:predicted Ser/Thr protein kinase